MKDKNGFTLVELLAVIAILAILVIVTLPNVMGMFNQAKERSFITELKNIYRVAQQEWVTESMAETKSIVYSRCSTCTGKSLDLSGRKQLDYFIKLSKSGDIIEFHANDGTYQFSYTGPGLISTNITSVKQISNLKDDEKIFISNNAVSGAVNVSDSTDTDDQEEPSNQNNTIRICVYVGDQSCSYLPYSTYNKQYYTVDENSTINTLINNGTLPHSMEYYFFIPKTATETEIRDYWNYFDYSEWDNPLKDETQGCYDGTLPPIC